MNTRPIASYKDVEEVIAMEKITKKVIASRMAEFFDPMGLYQPLKLTMRLEFANLNDKAWDYILSEKERKTWTDILKEYTRLPELLVKRCVIPENASSTKFRLLSVSDAAAKAGGAALYASYKLQDGTYSCQLLTARSRILHHSVPRNELLAIELMAELTHSMAMAMHGYVEETLYFTDSNIALCWVFAETKRLKLFVYNRVTRIRRLMEWTSDSEELKLFHIPGNENPADLLTKKHQMKIELVDQNSWWQNGPSWMKQSLEDMPVTKYTDVAIQKDQVAEMEKECVVEAFSLIAKPIVEKYEDGEAAETILGIMREPEYYEDRNELENVEFSVYAAAESEKVFGIDVIEYGWSRAKNLVRIAMDWMDRLLHNSNIKVGKKCNDCLICEIPGVYFERRDELFKRVEEFWFREETKLIKKQFKPSQLEKYQEVNGILYYVGRLGEENELKKNDLDCQVFFDSADFTGCLPIVRPESELFYAYLMEVHFKLRKHAGVEYTRMEVMKKMYVIGRCRHIIRKIRDHCVICKMMAKRTVELMIANHRFPRTMIAPVFYNIMADTVFGFRAKSLENSRTTREIYALVIVCLFTSATNILTLENMRTEEVVLALERHSARYGVPKNIFVDAGTNLAALDKVEYSVRDLNLQLYDAVGTRVYVSTPKSHEERGRVENKVRIIRGMLEDHLKKQDLLTCMKWETKFAHMATTIDQVPMAKGQPTSTEDFGFEILTPNRLKLGHNSSRSLHIRTDLNSSVLPSKVLDKNRTIMENFYGILLSRIHELVPRPNTWTKTDEQQPKVGDVVLFIFNDNKSGKDWRLGRVIEVLGHRVKITYLRRTSPESIPSIGIVERSVRCVSIIHTESDVPMNTTEHYKELIKSVYTPVDRSDILISYDKNF